jgi:hypothetical protein
VLRVTDPRGPDDAPEHVRQPPSGNGFDAPHSDDGFDAGAPDGPEGNGHPSPITAVPATPPGLRGRWIVPLAVVSAFSGMSMLLGGFIGVSVGGRAAPQSNLEIALALGGALLGGVAGVWVGASLAIRLTGQDPADRLAMTGAFGTIGLVVGIGIVVLATRTSLGLIAGLGLIAPGIGAAVGDRIAMRRTRSR